MALQIRFMWANPLGGSSPGFIFHLRTITIPIERISAHCGCWMTTWWQGELASGKAWGSLHWKCTSGQADFTESNVTPFWPESYAHGVKCIITRYAGLIHTGMQRSFPTLSMVIWATRIAWETVKLSHVAVYSTCQLGQEFFTQYEAQLHTTFTVTDAS